MLEYLGKASSTWFMGFFPLAEIYIAVPTAIAMGLDDLSIIFWSVFGNFTPALLITFMYEQITRFERINRWLSSLSSDKIRERINRWGIWFILFATPLAGVWLIAVAAKALGMNSRVFLLTCFASILLYAVVILVSIRAGVSVFSG
ncbi:MAG: small multi-drug export protein [Chloroflexota bacterium]